MNADNRIFGAVVALATLAAAPMALAQQTTDAAATATGATTETRCVTIREVHADGFRERQSCAFEPTEGIRIIRFGASGVTTEVVEF